jgi:hypothetical protein
MGAAVDVTGFIRCIPALGWSLPVMGSSGRYAFSIVPKGVKVKGPAMILSHIDGLEPNKTKYRSSGQHQMPTTKLLM